MKVNGLKLIYGDNPPRFTYPVPNPACDFGAQFARRFAVASGINDAVAQAAGLNKLSFAVKGDFGRLAAGLAGVDKLTRQFATDFKKLTDFVSPAVNGLKGRLEAIDRRRDQVLRRYGQQVEQLFSLDAIGDFSFGGAYAPALAVLLTGQPWLIRRYAHSLRHSSDEEDQRVADWLDDAADIIDAIDAAVRAFAQLAAAAVRVTLRTAGWLPFEPSRRRPYRPPPGQRDLYALVHAAHAPPAPSAAYCPEAA